MGTRIFRGWRGCVPFPLLAMCLIGAPIQAGGAETRIDFTAIVSGVNDALCQCMPPGAISIGDTLHGFYLFDSDVADTNPSSSTGQYVHSTIPHGIVVQHADYTWTSNPSDIDFHVDVDNNIPFGNGVVDRYVVSSYSNSPDEFTHDPLDLIYMGMLDSTATALSSDDLPVTIDTADWMSYRTLQMFGGGGWWIGADVVWMQTQLTSVSEAPRLTFLRSVYPNPFSSSVSVAYSPAQLSPVRLQVFDVTGRLVRMLVNANVAEGVHVANWNGTGSDGNSVPSGVYFCVLETGVAREIKKITLIR